MPTNLTIKSCVILYSTGACWLLCQVCNTLDEAHSERSCTRHLDKTTGRRTRTTRQLRTRSLYSYYDYLLFTAAFSALYCWLGGRKVIWPVKTERWGAGVVVRNKVQTCIWPSWCQCHSLSLASVKSRLVLPFWYWLTWVVLEKGLLNGCVCVCCCLWCCWLGNRRNFLACWKTAPLILRWSHLMTARHGIVVERRRIKQMKVPVVDFVDTRVYLKLK